MKKFLFSAAAALMVAGTFIATGPATATTGGNGFAQGVLTDGGTTTAMGATPDVTGVANTTSIPAAQQVHGQGPVGSQRPYGDTASIYWTVYIVKDGAEINTWVNTYAAACHYTGVNDYTNPAWNDGVGRWACEVSQTYDCGLCVPLPAPKTLFYVDRFDWSYSTQRGGDPLHWAYYRYALNPIKTSVLGNYYKLH